MRIEAVRKIANKEEIDYQFLLSLLINYSNPRDKITAWLKSGDLIRIKKGLYVFGEQAAQGPYSLEVLANLIYGPSAISLNYALAFYGLIPERVNVITSITPKRNKAFQTPAGKFTYHFLNSTKYPAGIELLKNSSNNHFLIASPEKALCDYIHIVDKKITLIDFDDINNYLFYDVRIDESILRKLKASNFSTLSKLYQDKRLVLLANFFKKWK